MQRAAAASPDVSTPTDSEEPTSKRRKVSGPTRIIDDEAIRAELALEEARRTAAIERQAALAGETRWVFSLQDEHEGKSNSNVRVESRGLRFIAAGYASIDEDAILVEEEEENAPRSLQRKDRGRTRFGHFEQEMEVRWREHF